MPAGRVSGSKCGAEVVLQPSLLCSLKRPDEKNQLPSWAARVRERLIVVEGQLRRLEREKQTLLGQLLDSPSDLVDAVLRDACPIVDAGTCNIAEREQGMVLAPVVAEQIECCGLWEVSSGCRSTSSSDGRQLHPGLRAPVLLGNRSLLEAPQAKAVAVKQPPVVCTESALVEGKGAATAQHCSQNHAEGLFDLTPSPARRRPVPTSPVADVAALHPDALTGVACMALLHSARAAEPPVLQPDCGARGSPARLQDSPDASESPASHPDHLAAMSPPRLQAPSNASESPVSHPECMAGASPARLPATPDVSESPPSRSKCLAGRSPSRLQASPDASESPALQPECLGRMSPARLQPSADAISEFPATAQEACSMSPNLDGPGASPSVGRLDIDTWAINAALLQPSRCPASPDLEAPATPIWHKRPSSRSCSPSLAMTVVESSDEEEEEEVEGSTPIAALLQDGNSTAVLEELQPGGASEGLEDVDGSTTLACLAAENSTDAFQGCVTPCRADKPVGDTEGSTPIAFLRDGNGADALLQPLAGLHAASSSSSSTAEPSTLPLPWLQRAHSPCKAKAGFSLLERIQRRQSGEGGAEVEAATLEVGVHAPEEEALALPAGSLSPRPVIARTLQPELLGEEALVAWMAFFGMKAATSRSFMVKKLKEIEAYLGVAVSMDPTEAKSDAAGSAAPETSRCPSAGYVGRGRARGRGRGRGRPQKRPLRETGSEPEAAMRDASQHSIKPASRANGISRSASSHDHSRPQKRLLREVRSAPDVALSAVALEASRSQGAGQECTSGLDHASSRKRPLRAAASEPNEAKQLKQSPKAARSARAAEKADALEQALEEAIRNDSELYERLLLFEPVELGEIRDRLALNTRHPELANIGEQRLRSFLDAQGVFFASSWGRTARSKRKDAARGAARPTAVAEVSEAA